MSMRFHRAASFFALGYIGRIHINSARDVEQEIQAKLIQTAILLLALLADARLNGRDSAMLDALFYGLGSILPIFSEIQSEGLGAFTGNYEPMPGIAHY